METIGWNAEGSLPTLAKDNGLCVVVSVPSNGSTVCHHYLFSLFYRLTPSMPERRNMANAWKITQKMVLLPQNHLL